MDEHRNDVAMGHFRSRSQRPKMLGGGPHFQSVTSVAPPLRGYVVFDQGFGSVGDEIDDVRYNYIGTSPQLSRYETMDAKRRNYIVMGDSYVA